MEDARIWRASCLMTEIRRIGAHYTWSNKQMEWSRIFSKLDRALSNEAWVDAFQNSEDNFNWDVLSDHCYCIIKIVISQILGVKPFKFFNMCSKHEDFRDTVLKSWSMKVLRSNILGIVQKLNRLKVVLAQFNKHQVGDVIIRYLAAKEKFQHAQFMLQQEPHSTGFQQAEHEVCIEFSRLSKMYESFLRQRSKITWLRFGDDNTSYFYVSLKQRSACNRITTYLDEHGKIVDCYDDVVNHFKGFMGSPSTAISRIQQDSFKFGSIQNLDQHLSLVKPFSKRDVKMTMFSIHSVKGPGPDGFGSGFFKSMWRDLGEEISTAMLCVRLTTVLPLLTHQNQGAFIKHRSLAHNIFILQDLLKGYSRNNISTRCLIKMDVSKAYDSIDWYFLEDLLNALHGGFSGMKGLRQGDPISPLLVVLIMEYLTRLLAQAAQHKDFRFHPLCRKLNLVNLCFADDLILFCKGSFRSVQILHAGFSKFSQDSGLTMNLSKSHIYFGGVHSDEKRRIMECLKIEEDSFHLKYLGMRLIDYAGTSYGEQRVTGASCIFLPGSRLFGLVRSNLKVDEKRLLDYI
ncbi:uncharacterized protein LOC133799993 [Humulus lupulus]|uniref:uncharacterized protein LOC133799993 n=1 Tax=Humulus lupulus TaxID=3486 RepID=UPI002B40AAEB|nr:uncharacterized protein LOC133799993 [Humulus lupulus]